MLKTDGLLKKCLIWLSLIGVLEYSLFHIEYIFSGSDVGDFLGIIRYYLTEGWEFMIPSVGGMLMLIMLTYSGYKRALVFGALLSLSRVFYYLPWYYMYYIYNMGFDSLESIFFSFLTSVGFSLLTYIESALFFGVALLVLRLRALKSCDAIAYLKDAMPRHDRMNVTEGSGMLLGSMALLAFIRRCVILTTSTVTFFVEHGSSYRTGEVISIIIDYLVALIYLIVTYLIISAVKRRILDARLIAEEKDA